MADEEDGAEIRAHGYRYLVGGRQPERNAGRDDFQAEGDGEEVIRTPSPRNPGQEKSPVQIQRRQKGQEVYLLCLSEGRQEKDRAMGETHPLRLKKDGEKFKARVEKGRLQEAKKIDQAIGRLQERYPRVARYYRMDYEAAQKMLTWQEDREKQAVAAKLDGGSVLKTDHQDLTADEIWRTDLLLTRVEAAFRARKSPLAERPRFPHLERPPPVHLFLCVLAYPLRVGSEKRFLDSGVHTSGWTLRQQRRTHQGVTVVLPTGDGRALKIRKSTTPEPVHREIDLTLQIPTEVIKPVKTWHHLSPE